MRACHWLIASSLILASCGSEETPDDDAGLIIQDASPVTTTDASASSGGNDASASMDSGAANDAGSASDSGSASNMDGGAAADAGNKDGGPLADATTADGAVVADGGTDGATADGGADYAIAMLGAACTTALDKACTGHNAADKLVCLDGKWAHNGSCDTDARCESQKGPSQGLCVNIATGCTGKMPGASVCDSNTVKTCGPDLTSLNTTTTCGANSHCEEGAPASCKCDTGYTAGSGGTCANANDCADNPCGASGSGNTCTDALNDFSCTCGNNYWLRGDNKACTSRFDRVSSGGNRTCAIRRDRTVACWGEGTEGNSSTPVVIAGISDATQISVGLDHACVLRSGGTVQCWGRNNHGQLGNGNRTDSLRTPVTVSNFNNVQQISAGAGFTCAIGLTGLFDNRRVFCWGDNALGQLGIGNNNADATTPQQINNSSNNNAQVSAGTGHACARDGNTLRCWGRNNHGQLGNNGTADRVNSPVNVTGNNLGNLSEVLAGNNFTCIRRNGSVYCWGAPIDGSTGTDVLQPPSTAVATDLTDATQLSSGVNATSVCARRSGNNGNVVCWGSDAEQQLGNGDGGDSAAPAAINGSVTNVREVSVGSKHACLVKSNDGDIWCWGEGSNGELGNGMKNDAPAPVTVAH